MTHHDIVRLLNISRAHGRASSLSALLLSFILIAGSSVAAAQQVSVSASVNTTTVEPGETLQYTVRIESSSTPPVSTPSAPDVEGLELVRSSPRASRNISIVGGRIHQRMLFEWTLRAASEGSGRIGSTRIYIDETEHQTDPIDIRITNQAATTQNRSSRARSNTSDDQADNVFIRAQVNDSDVYTNEQLTVEYILYFREDFQVQNSRMANSWKADGLWREEMKVDQRPLPETEVVNGLRYNTITLKRSAFFPTRRGSLTIDPLSIETEILRPYRQNGPFNFRAPRDERLYSAEIASGPVTITARPLPDDAPSSFNGAVGAFTLDHELDRTTVETGEAVTLNITISGQGNISTLGQPALDLPASIEVYDPQVDSQIDREGRLLEGRKTFSYTLVPHEVGTHAVPSVEWTYFDPDREQFITRNTGPITLDVQAADVPEAVAVGPDAAAGEIAGPMTGTSLTAQETPPLHRQVWPYAGVAGPAAALLLLLGFRRWRERRSQRRAALDRQARSIAKRYLSRAEEFRQRQQSQAFYDAIERSLRGFIGARLGIPAQGLTKQQVDTHLERARIPAEIRMTVRDLLQTCEKARFSPAPPNSRKMDTTYERAADCLSRLDSLLDSEPSDTKKIS